MLPIVECDEDDHNNWLKDIETIAKRLSRNSTLSSSSKSIENDPNSKLDKEDNNSKKDKKSSIWSWKPLRALSLTRSKKFNCCFSLQVHLIEGLPSSFNDWTLCVHWKRRDEHSVTPPAKVIQGVAKFQDILNYTCSIVGSKSGFNNSAKYEAKHFLLYVSVLGDPEIDLGSHRLDITRLLPLSLEDLEEEKTSGKWSTSYRLSGKAKGAVMNVSFGYMVVGDNNSLAPNVLTSRQNCMALSETDVNLCKFPARAIDEVKDLHEVLASPKSAMASSTNTLSKKFDDEETCSPLHKKDELVLKENLEPVKFDLFQENLETVESVGYPLHESSKGKFYECEHDGFSVVDRGVEFSPNEHLQVKESIEEAIVDSSEESSDEFSNKKAELCTKELLMQEIESVLNSVSEWEAAALDSPKIMEIMSECKLSKSLSLDDATEQVASEFLSMLGVDNSPTGFSSESDPESPRERLLRQFEKDIGSEGFSLFDMEIGYDDEDEGDYGSYDASYESEQGEFSTGITPPSLLHDLQEGVEFEDVRRKPKGQILEDLETEALMREWGFNEEAFQHSPPKDFAGGFGIPMHHLPAELPAELPRLPPLAEGFGPFLQTKDGGFIRSMNPSLFMNSKNGGNLIMQVSNPVVMPAEMGSGIMETLQYLASVGIEKLSMQANKYMPLEDITGKTMQQISWEAMQSFEGKDRQWHLQRDLVTLNGSTCAQRDVKGSPSRLKSDEFISSSIGNQGGSGFLSLEDLAPLAMDKIEALSMEGLKIQYGMSEEDAPSNIIAQQSFKDPPGLQHKGVNIGASLGLDGAAALQLLDIKCSNDEVNGIMGLSLTLDEWMRLDSGEIDDIDDISEHTRKLLAAHHANSFDVVRESSKGRKKQDKGHSRKCGLLGNNFTVALMVQLRDPLRNYEPVGTPMLSLIQVERVLAPPKQKIYLTVSEVGNKSDEDDDCEIKAEEDMKENKEERSTKESGIAQFRITEVHVAGLKIESHKKKLLGTSKQQQSGSRWLIANGMSKSKSNKNQLMKSKPASKFGAQVTTIKVQPVDTLWSISSRIFGTGAKRNDFGALNPHIRNPNIIIPKENVRKTENKKDRINSQPFIITTTP